MVTPSSPQCLSDKHTLCLLGVTCARDRWLDEPPAALSVEAQTAHCEVQFNEQRVLSGGHWVGRCRDPGPSGQGWA